MSRDLERTGRQPIELVWLKRDLRVRDHAPLAAACATGRPVLVAYVYEPEHLRSPEFEASHLEFINRSLLEVDEGLRTLGLRLTTRHGAMPDVLDAIREELRARQMDLATVRAHVETGLAWSFARDRRVAAWCREHGVAFLEAPQNGVERRLSSRDGWSARWLAFMTRPVHEVPTTASGVENVPSDGILEAAGLDLTPSTKIDAQVGGALAGRATLRSFLVERGRDYRTDMSSPVEGWNGCSRLSPHLAWGTLSIREVYRATASRVLALRAARGDEADHWRRSIESFGSRLRWHCHFMQKLETEPEIEFENMNRGFDGLRENDFDESKFVAWKTGRTGHPLVDACMRCVQATGWLNFRMRAMLVSFASYHLWLHWREPAVFLARHFLDFEPGIHFSQFQMQSGVTGMNSLRIYSPPKQLADQDPTGVFVRRWVPELARVPTPRLAAPHRMTRAEQTDAGCRIGADYPEPIVEHEPAYATARQRMARARAHPAVRAAAGAVFATHGSRRRPGRRLPRGP